MDFSETALKLPVLRFDIIAEQEKKVKRHGDLLPSSIRTVISAP